MLTELDFPVAGWRPRYKALQEAFIETVDPVARLLFAAETRTQGEQGYAVRALLGRAINDIVVAFHLTIHGYLNQAYNAMRQGYESCELVELLAGDEDEARNWVHSKEPWKEFAPGRVRQALGKDKVDDAYSHMSELAHPRFAASQLTSFAKQPTGEQPQEDPEVLQVVLRIGPFLIDEHPAVAHAAALLTIVIGLLGLRFSHLVLLGALDERTWQEALEASVEAQKGYVEAVAELLKDFGQDDLARQTVVHLDRGLEILREQAPPKADG